MIKTLLHRILFVPDSWLIDELERRSHRTFTITGIDGKQHKVLELN